MTLYTQLKKELMMVCKSQISGIHKLKESGRKFCMTKPMYYEIVDFIEKNRLVWLIGKSNFISQNLI